MSSSGDGVRVRRAHLCCTAATTEGVPLVSHRVQQLCLCIWGPGSHTDTLDKAAVQRVTTIVCFIPLIYVCYRVQQLRQGGWEWTATPFEPLPGFEAMPEYPEYSTGDCALLQTRLFFLFFFDCAQFQGFVCVCRFAFILTTCACPVQFMCIADCIACE